MARKLRLLGIFCHVNKTKLLIVIVKVISEATSQDLETDFFWCSKDEDVAKDSKRSLVCHHCSLSSLLPSPGRSALYEQVQVLPLIDLPKDNDCDDRVRSRLSFLAGGPHLNSTYLEWHSKQRSSKSFSGFDPEQGRRQKSCRIKRGAAY